MPLRDHFHSGDARERFDASFHSRWAVYIADRLMELLPKRYVADINVNLGTAVQADIAEFDRGFSPDDVHVNGTGGVAVQPWAPPAPGKVFSGTIPDEFELRVIDPFDSYRLLAVIELVSPANKDAPDSRRAFAGKCAGLLAAGVGLVVVDIVTDMHFNLHDELADLLGWGDDAGMPADATTYAASYRPARRDDANVVDHWGYPFAIGHDLPTVPLYLRGTTTVPLELELTYALARRRSGFH